MADSKISDLTAATSVAATDVVPVVQAGTTKKAAVSLLAPLPVHIFRPASTYQAASQGNWTMAGVTFYGSGVSPYGIIRAQSSAPANGDWIAWDELLDVGTWRLDWAFNTASDQAKVQASIDGVDVGTLVDEYASGNTPTLVSVTGIVVATKKLVRVKFTANGKNASSSGYNLELGGYTLTRTGA